MSESRTELSYFIPLLMFILVLVFLCLQIRYNVSGSKIWMKQFPDTTELFSFPLLGVENTNGASVSDLLLKGIRVLYLSSLQIPADLNDIRLFLKIYQREFVVLVYDQAESIESLMKQNTKQIVTGRLVYNSLCPRSQVYVYNTRQTKDNHSLEDHNQLSSEEIAALPNTTKFGDIRGRIVLLQKTEVPIVKIDNSFIIGKYRDKVKTILNALDHQENVCLLTPPEVSKNNKDRNIHNPPDVLTSECTNVRKKLLMLHSYVPKDVDDYIYQLQRVYTRC